MCNFGEFKFKVTKTEEPKHVSCSASFEPELCWELWGQRVQQAQGLGNLCAFVWLVEVCSLTRGQTCEGGLSRHPVYVWADVLSVCVCLCASVFVRLSLSCERAEFDFFKEPFGLGCVQTNFSSEEETQTHSVKFRAGGQECSVFSLAGLHHYPALLHLTLPPVGQFCDSVISLFGEGTLVLWTFSFSLLVFIL